MSTAHCLNKTRNQALKGRYKTTHMGQSLVKNYIHIVFRTKNGTPNIDDQLEAELFKYLGGTCNKLECQVIKVGGYKDHVHILISAPPTMAPSEIMRRIKGRTASKLFEEFPALKKRY